MFQTCVMRNTWGHSTFGVCKHLGIIEKKRNKAKPTHTGTLWRMHSKEGDR